MNDIKGGIRDSEVYQFPVEEEDGAVSLVLGGGGDIFCDGWMVIGASLTGICGG